MSFIHLLYASIGSSVTDSFNCQKTFDSVETAEGETQSFRPATLMFSQILNSIETDIYQNL